MSKYQLPIDMLSIVISWVFKELHDGICIKLEAFFVWRDIITIRVPPVCHGEDIYTHVPYHHGVVWNPQSNVPSIFMHEHKKRSLVIALLTLDEPSSNINSV